MEPVGKEIQEDRYRNRRKMAWYSFTALTVTGISLIIVGVFLTDLAQRIDSLSFVIGTVFSLWASVILAYFGVTAIADKEKIKNEK